MQLWLNHFGFKWVKIHNFIWISYALLRWQKCLIVMWLGSNQQKRNINLDKTFAFTFYSSCAKFCLQPRSYYPIIQLKIFSFFLSCPLRSQLLNYWLLMARSHTDSSPIYVLMRSSGQIQLVCPKFCRFLSWTSWFFWHNNRMDRTRRCSWLHMMLASPQPTAVQLSGQILKEEVSFHQGPFLGSWGAAFNGRWTPWEILTAADGCVLLPLRSVVTTSASLSSPQPTAVRETSLKT